MRLELHEVGKAYRTRWGVTPALQNVTFAVASGEFVCILGPSGCGKSTALSIIAGLETPDSGQVLQDAIPVSGPGSDRVVIFQEEALFPWLNVLDNASFGLEVAGVRRKERQARAMEQLRMVGLERFGRASVHELSGGMKQRAALARALAMDPKVLLMDEPFAALDAQTRDRLHGEVQSIWLRTNKTILFVTHNVREALVLGDRILLMSAGPGTIKQDYHIDLPRPREMEDHRLVDAAREILADLRVEVEKEREERYAKLAD
ncbi:MAG: ABC transporter ATP-binding protein [Anaerolineales bacterium]|nr:ABC transporter ATP-binding protein [Anaerolineales bacterium]